MRRGAARFILFAIGLAHRRCQIFTAFGLACGPRELGIIVPRGFASGLGTAGFAINNCAIIAGPF